MPFYNFECLGDGSTSWPCEWVGRKLLKPGEQKLPQVCPDCGAPLKRMATGPSVQVMERLDNGAMSHAVERLKDAEELNKDRARNDPRNKE